MVQMAEIKKEIEELPKQEYVNLRQWFAKKDWKYGISKLKRTQIQGN